MTPPIRIPVVVQKRKLLSGPNKGAIKEVRIYCKYLEDVIEHRRFYTVIGGPNQPSYEVIGAKLEVGYLDKLEKTFEKCVEEGVM